MNRQDYLQSILSFAHCRKKEDVLSQSAVIAKELIQNWKIVSPAGERRFLGLEFYLFIPEIFEDDATHTREEQLELGTFYFHTKSKAGWTPPIFNRHGVDITCGYDYGDEQRDIYGGILLRHLSGVGNRDGSGLALRSLVRGDRGFESIKRGSAESRWSEGEIDFFSRTNNKSVFGSEMYLQHDPLSEKIVVDSAERVGIKKTKFATEELRFVAGKRIK